MLMIDYDRDFLRELDRHRSKTTYARIISLTLDETPIQSIEGRVTQGSINLDGDSAVRRSCSLTMVAKDVDIKDYYWGLENKFKLEIGLKNTIDNRYPDIIWFPQGVYIITSFSTALATNSYTINIQGKDKMCMLNGEVGGSITAPTQFDSWEEEDVHGNWVIKKYPIKDIVRDAVHEYGKEPFENIVINDLDDMGLELLEYRFDDPMFLFREKNDDTYYNGTFNADTKCFVDGKATTIGAKDNETGEYLYNYDSLVNALLEAKSSTIFTFPGEEDKEYCIAKIEYGDTAGYRLTDLIYPDDLIGNVGESLTSVLDKIKNMLGEFEYFYDIDGKFIFQRKKNYINSVWTPIIDQDNTNEDYVDNIALSNSETYTFSGNELFTALNNTPNLNNVRNDYSVWGSRKGVGGAELPIHMRYAIDEKPQQYTNLDGVMYTVRDLSEVVPLPQESLLPDCLKQEFDGGRWWDIHDWAEVYRAYTGAYPTGLIGTYCETTTKMDLNRYFPKGTSWRAERPLFLFEVEPDGTLGYTGHNPTRDGDKPARSCSHTYSYFTNLAKDGVRAYVFNPQIPTGTKILYKKVDWREIIFQMQKDFRKHHRDDDFAINLIKNNKDIYPTGMTGYEAYYIDLEGFWRQLYYPEDAMNEEVKRLEAKIEAAEKEYAQANQDKDADKMTAIESRIRALKSEKEDFIEYYNGTFYPADHELAFWNKEVYETPHTLNFWFDFLDMDGQLSEYSCKAIGPRPKAVNDNNVKSIYFRETPMIVFAKDVNAIERKSGYRYFQTPDVETMFSISTQGKSAKDAIDELLYKHSYAIESANITSIPIYYLQLNTRVNIFDDRTGVNGNYIISKASIPLTYNGTMNITATRVADDII